MYIKYTEDKKYLLQVANEIKKLTQKINKIKKANDNIIFTIGSTADSTKFSKPYLTPVRKIDNAYVFGIIIYTQCQSIIFSSIVDGKVDYIFVDAEKKLPLLKNPDYSPLKSFKIKVDNLTISKYEFGNISAICNNFVQISKLHLFKGNDLTVETTWFFLVNYFKELSGKKFLIIGAGNIGSKLALKLVESGAKIVLVPKKNSKSTIASSINKIKQKSLLSKILVSHSKVKAAINCDAILGCTNLVPVINGQMVNAMNKNGVVIDVGKENLTNDGLKAIQDTGIYTWRADISPMIQSMVTAAQKMKNFYKNYYGRTQQNNFFLVSGGYIGNKYDIIVDNHNNPKFILGICDGKGSVFKTYNKIAKANLDKIKIMIKVNSK